MIKNGLRYWGYAATVFALHLGKMGTLGIVQYFVGFSHGQHDR